jgi:diguanylate cyclase (GGDEF)-like protein
LVPGLFTLYLLLQWVWPSQFHAVLLGLAIYLAARAWEVRGGLIASLVSGLLMAFGLLRLFGVDGLRNPQGFGGYMWAGVAATTLGAYVGSATRQARTLGNVNANLRQAQQRLAALHTIALSLSATLDVNTLLDTILEQLGKLWGYDFGAILLYDQADEELVLAASHGYAREVGYRQPAGAGLVGAVVATGEPVCVVDVTLDPRYVAGVQDARSELAVPLKWRGRTIGVLNVESRQTGAYGPTDIALLTTVAEQAASYIGNARLYQQTQQAAITDAHTGLFNYRHFQDQVTGVIRDAQLTGSTCSLIMLDLDYFKRCNDTYGHPTGDEVLQELARVLRDSCRGGDMIFRYGGEEFAVILPDAKADMAVRVAERIRARIAGHRFTTRQGHRLDMYLTASLGVANYPRDAISSVDLVIAADKALYQAKTGGRDKVVSAGAELVAAAPD